MKDKRTHFILYRIRWRYKIYIKVDYSLHRIRENRGKRKKKPQEFAWNVFYKSQISLNRHLEDKWDFNVLFQQLIYLRQVYFWLCLDHTCLLNCICSCHSFICSWKKVILLGSGDTKNWSTCTHYLQNGGNFCKRTLQTHTCPSGCFEIAG